MATTLRKNHYLFLYVSKQYKGTLMEKIEEWLSPQGVNDRYQFSISTLAKWRMDNKNLPFSKIGKFIKYSTTDIENFIKSNVQEVA